MSKTMPERIATAEEWIEGHEKACEKRYAAIQADIGEIRGDLKTATRLLFGLLISVIAWLGVQVWNGSQANAAVDRARIAALEHTTPPVTVYQNQTPAAPKAPPT